MERTSTPREAVFPRLVVGQFIARFLATLFSDPVTRTAAPAIPEAPESMQSMSGGVEDNLGVDLSIVAC